ncbi:UDP:flavonoid glycosyltransferase YjiC, YdhE family [Allokutzneria albata]|uniref:UDP:flavonoid glycosyltransferase YjiC, YdhE family n=1 Tax=Allokutzneria albata TaxID=211114 RepID=A0A1G9RKR7_ALLAB|nr:UDP:flavonoid glycosyltransferase YjiC, YdhE family [Allokutzneria albata]
MTVGSRGDVAPYTGPAVRLREAGHQVVVSAPAEFADMLGELGLEHRPMAGDMRALLASEQGRAWAEKGTGLKGLKVQLEIAEQLMNSVADSVMDAAADADVLLLQRGAMINGYLAGKALGIPAVALELFPGVPTAEFGLAGLGGKDLGRVLNRWLPRLALRVPTSIDASVKQFCRRIGLPPVGVGAARRMMLADHGFPVLHGFSRHVVPRPVDWPSGVDVVGYWWPERPPGWTAPAELVDFLKAGPPPVFLGFGSMAPGAGERLSEVVTETVRRAGIRAVVQAGWSGLTATGDDVMCVESVPHDWLFPQMAAVVHHCGAGTTGASVRAGVPVVPTPVLADQPFWASRLAKVGVSPGSVPFAKLAAEPLAELVTRAVTEPGYRACARVLAGHVRAEDGAGAILRLVERANPRRV